MLGRELHTNFCAVLVWEMQEPQKKTASVKKCSDYANAFLWNYSFGLTMPGRSSNTANPNDNYKFTGYENDDEGGLDIYHAGARGYDPVLGRFMQIDRFYDKYPNMSTYQYGGNNPLYFIDVNGDSLIEIQIQDDGGLITNDEPILIDHRYKSEFLDILSTAVANGTNININSSFRPVEEQMSSEIQDNGTTPAGTESKHTAGLAIDFNLYTNNNRSEGMLAENAGQNATNNTFIEGIGNSGSRFGGDFSSPGPDPIHFDAASTQGVQTKYGVPLTQIQRENQNQYTNNRNSIVVVTVSFLRNN